LLHCFWTYHFLTHSNLYVVMNMEFFCSHNLGFTFDSKEIRLVFGPSFVITKCARMMFVCSKVPNVPNHCSCVLDISISQYSVLEFTDTSSTCSALYLVQSPGILFRGSYLLNCSTAQDTTYLVKPEHPGQVERYGKPTICVLL